MMRQQLGNSQLSILTAGGVGGVMFWCSVYPFDVIKVNIIINFTNYFVIFIYSLFVC